jgi:hypothetical protein
LRFWSLSPIKSYSINIKIIYSEDFIERIGNAVYNYEPYKNDNNIRLRLKYEFVLEDSKDDSNKGFCVTDTDYYTRKVKGTLGEIVESIINKDGFETMILDFTLTHKKHNFYEFS